MTELQPSLARERYPLRYWSLLVLIIGFPNFLAFDATGLTHSNGLFNLTSMMSILITLMTGLILAMLTVLTRSSIIQRPIKFPTWICLLLLLNFAVSSILEPSVIAAHLTKIPSTDLAIALYRLAEWTLAIIVILSVVSRESEQTASDMVVRTIGIVCWVKICLVWIMLPIDHRLVYAASHEADSGIARLGGNMLNPVHLGIFSGIAFFYNLFFVRSRRLRFGGCLLALATLALTYSRSIQIIFLCVLMVYMLFSSHAKTKFFGILTVVSGALGAVIFSDKILSYLARGQGTGNITSLSERTHVWQASEKAFWLRPWLGYGFISGPKHAISAEWNATHWIPPHAHSDFLQAFLSGGVVAGVLMIILYLTPIWFSLRRLKEGPVQVFLLIAYILISSMSLIEVVLTTQFSYLAGVLLLAYVAIINKPKMSASKPRIVPTPPMTSFRQQVARTPV